MAIVALTREMGSLGTFIGMEVAQQLSYEFLRQDITRDVAREYQALEDRVVAAVERRPSMFEAVTHSARRYQTFVAAEVLEAALRDRVVIIGRWSTLLLRGVRHAVRVRVCAPPETRVARIMERLRVDRAGALERVQASDTGVRARIRQVFDAEWSDPLLYHLTINTEELTLQHGVAQVLALVRAPEFQPTEESRADLENRALAARVRAALKANRQTAGIELIVQADRGRVTLAGTVLSEADLRAAAQIAERVDGVRGLDQQARVLKMPAE